MVFDLSFLVCLDHRIHWGFVIDKKIDIVSNGIPVKPTKFDVLTNL